jgi:hypothetical protein
MAELPKLIIKPFGYPSEFIYDLEEARNCLNFDSGVIVIEGQIIHCYDELVQVAVQDKYKDREVIEVVLLPTITGG